MLFFKHILLKNSIILKTFGISALYMLSRYSSCARTNDILINELQDAGIIKSEEVKKAMMTVDRGNYAPVTGDPYDDSPQYIGFDATISAPHMHAFALEYMLPFLKKEGAKVLDVGCGSGYLTAVFARLNPTASVYGIDYIDGLVSLSEANILKEDGDLLETKRVVLSVGDGWKGWSKYEPFDVIHVGAAAESLPLSLLQQLKVGGIMIIPVGSHFQNLQMVEKILNESGKEEIKAKTLMGVRYVPLVKKNIS